MSAADKIIAALSSGPTQTHEPDPCCGKHLSRALDGLQAAESWECPKCGQQWRPTIVGTFRHWVQHCPFVIF